MPADLKALRARVESASGPDRKLDMDLKLTAAAFALHGGMGPDETRTNFGGLYDDPPPYSASIDAAVALVERVLPVADIEVRIRHFASGPVYQADVGEVPQHEAATPALAICAALLSALDAKETPNG